MINTRKKAHVKTTKQECLKCKGEGWVWGTNSPYGGVIDRRFCMDCQGSGKVTNKNGMS